jgi:GNAT superfamily N-acetyltransferase
MYSIKKTGSEHIPFLVKGMRELFKMHQQLDASYKIPDDELLKEAFEKDQLSFIALYKNTPVGFVRGRYVPASPEKSTSYAILHDMFVEEAHRGSGVGTLLLKAFESEAEDNGTYSIELNVDVRNTKGVNMWEKNGFETYQFRMKKQLK